MSEFVLEKYCEEKIPETKSVTYKNCNLDKDLFFNNSKILNRKVTRIFDEMKKINTFLVKENFTKTEIFDIESFKKVFEIKTNTIGIVFFEYIEKIFESFKNVIFLKQINVDDLFTYHKANKFINAWFFLSDLKNNNIIKNTDFFNIKLFNKYSNIRTELSKSKSIFKYDINLINYKIDYEENDTIYGDNFVSKNYKKSNKKNTLTFNHGLSSFRKIINLHTISGSNKLEYAFKINENCFLKNFSLLINNPTSLNLKNKNLIKYIKNIALGKSYVINNENDFLRYINDDDKIVFFIGLENDLAVEDKCSFDGKDGFSSKSNLSYQTYDCDLNNKCFQTKNYFLETYKKYKFSNKKHISAYFIGSNENYNYYLYQEIIIVNSPILKNNSIHSDCFCVNSVNYQQYIEPNSLLISLNGLNLLLTNNTIILPYKIKIIKKQISTNKKPSIFKIMRNNFFDNFYNAKELKFDLLDEKKIHSILEFFLFTSIDKQSDIENYLLSQINSNKQINITKNTIIGLSYNIEQMFKIFSKVIPKQQILQILNQNKNEPDYYDRFLIDTNYEPISIIIGEN